MILRSFIFDDVETDGEGYVFHNQFASFKLVNREEINETERRTIRKLH